MNLLKDQFNPLFFQASLAAGGVALMPFNFLEFAIPHNEGLINFSDIIWTSLSSLQMVYYSLLIVIMFAAVLIHIALTLVFFRYLVSWIKNRQATEELINDPYRNVTIFPIVGSLAMSANVIWAPVGFFIPQVAAGLQSLMLPSLIYFGLLWVALYVLEFRLIRVLRKNTINIEKFNFIWLLDVFTFGLVSLTGSGIAITTSNPSIATFAVIGTVITLIIGLIMFFIKLLYLISTQIKVRKLPDAAVLPAFFLVVPIACLYGLSLFRISSYFQTYLSIDTSGMSMFIMNSSYVIAVAWVVLTVYLLWYYFRNEFIKSKYSAPQWGIV